jgi:hypothetical protein
VSGQKRNSSRESFIILCSLQTFFDSVYKHRFQNLNRVFLLDYPLLLYFVLNLMKKSADLCGCQNFYSGLWWNAQHELSYYITICLLMVVYKDCVTQRRRFYVKDPFSVVFRRFLCTFSY